MNQKQIIIDVIDGMDTAERDYGVIARIEAIGLMNYFGGKTPGQTITSKLGTLAKAGLIARSKTNQESNFWHYASIKKQYLLYPTPTKRKKTKKIMKIELPMVVDDIIIINGKKFIKDKEQNLLF